MVLLQPVFIPDSALYHPWWTILINHEECGGGRTPGQQLWARKRSLFWLLGEGCSYLFMVPSSRQVSCCCFGNFPLGLQGLNQSSLGVFVFSEKATLLKPLFQKSLGAFKPRIINLRSWILGVVGALGKQYWIKCVEHFKTAFDCTFKIGNANWNSSWVL